MKRRIVSDTQRPPKRLILHPAAFLLLFVSGCARYEYDVVQPAELAGHVGETSWVALRRGNDVEYRLRASDNRLVMLVYNRGDRTVKLLGADSAVVDPRGESHPVRSATIPPGSYAKRIFPPPPARVQPYGPSFGVGVGYIGAAHVRAVSHGAPYHYHAHPYHAHPHHYHWAGYHDFEPRYYTVYDPNDRTGFDWPGESAVRFLLAFEPEGGEVFTHEFLIRRRKM